MARVERLSDPKLYQNFIEMKAIGNHAVQKAQEANRRLGVANVYSRNGKMYFENEKGEITLGSPYKK